MAKIDKQPLHGNLLCTILHVTAVSRTVSTDSPQHFVDYSEARQMHVGQDQLNTKHRYMYKEE